MTKQAYRPACANRAHFALTIEAVESGLQVHSFSGKEAISQPFVFELTLVSKDRALSLDALLHKSAFLQLHPGGKGIHGHIYAAGQGHCDQRLAYYNISLRPRLSYLAHRINQRIFQNLAVPQVVAMVLQEHGILSDACSFNLKGVYPKRRYCVQYNESDLHFIQRLCEEEGIHYHFLHHGSGHTVVFGDDQAVFARLAPVAYKQGTGAVADGPVIQRFGVRLETRAGRASQRDYNFEKPWLTLEGNTGDGGWPDLEDYTYPGRFTDRERGAHLAGLALERHRSDFQLAEGSSNQPLLATGHVLPLTEHPRAMWNALWLLTQVHHEGRQPQVLEELAPDKPFPLNDDFQGYRNRFEATPWSVSYRPPLRHFKPQVLGSQSAVVTGPEGEEIYCDEYGRVKVQFHWDRAAKANDQTSCWLRVASTWAGAHYGGIAVPRVGMEVVVTFLEGDPDQPLVTGCLYHQAHPAPYALPAHKTRSTIKTLSTAGGGGGNELRIEDKKGQEQVYVHAQRDLDIRVRHDQRCTLGHERHETVERNSYRQLEAQEHHRVYGDRKVQVHASDHLSVGGDQRIKVGTGQYREAGREIHLRSGQKVVLHAGCELTVKAAGSFIKLDPGGITLHGPVSKLNTGGEPGKVSPAAPRAPGPLQQADTDKPGEVLGRRLRGDTPLVELCRKPQGGTPLDCPLTHCPCRAAMAAGATV